MDGKAAVCSAVVADLWLVLTQVSSHDLRAREEMWKRSWIEIPLFQLRKLVALYVKRLPWPPGVT